MQTKTTGLNAHLMKQESPRVLLNTLVCQYEPPCLRNQLGSVHQTGNKEHVCTLKRVIERTL